MSENNNTNRNELSFEEKINANFDGITNDASTTTEKLRDVNKKLPKWNLEPPMNFIK